MAEEIARHVAAWKTPCLSSPAVQRYKFKADCTVLRFRDTMWLQLLANIAWDGAKVLGP